MKTIKKVADLAGVSLKTLRHYDKIGLLVPSGRGENGYRLYSNDDLNKLQQIMLFKELDFSLDEIKNIINCDDFEIGKSLARQIEMLKAKSKRLENVITLAQNTLKNFNGEIEMTDNQKFEAFKDKMIADNDAKYGEELAQKYDKDTLNASKKKLKSLTKEQFDELEKLSEQVNQAFIKAKATQNPSSVEAKLAVELHKRWLMFYWADFNKNAYIGLANNYVDDPRFASYYDKLDDGMAVFVRDSILAYCKEI